jgi:hypothetical protein
MCRDRGERVMVEIWFWMAKFFAELFLAIGLIVVVFVAVIFFSVFKWLWEYRKFKEKE